MAIVIENTTIEPSSPKTGDASFSHTGTGSNLTAVVTIAQRYGADSLTVASNVTYGGVNMTRAVGGTAVVGTYIYYLTGASSGAQTVSVNFVSGSEGRSHSVVAYTLTGVDQTTPLDGTDANGAGSGTSVTSTIVTSKDGCQLFDVFASTGTSAPTVNSGQTDVESGLYSSGGYGHSKEAKATAGSESMGWTFTSGENQQSMASFAPATAAPAGFAHSQSVVIV